MKHLRPLFFLVLLTLILISSCKKEGITIVHISDTHYLAQGLADEERLKNIDYNGDGKATHIINEVIDSFIDEMIKLKPNAVLISGDITYNGEKQSHIELRDKLKRLQDKGIKVFVMTGNHDITQKANALRKDGVEEIEGTKAQEFEEIWWDFGYGDAISQDPYSNSYLALLSDNLYLLSIDTNTGSSGSVRSKTLEWIESTLKNVKDSGGKVITMTHQNLFVHNPRYTFGYVINNNKTLLSILEKYDIKLNLSGHLHIQHIATEDNITDIAVSSFTDYPLQYGVLEVDKEWNARYCTKELNNKKLLEEAKFTFDSSTLSKANEGLEERTEEEREKMLEVAKAINREYFQGKIGENYDSALELWKETPSSYFSSYLINLAKDTTDYRKWEGSL